MISQHRGQHSWAERLADLTVIGYTDKPGKAEALASAAGARHRALRWGRPPATGERTDIA